MSAGASFGSIAAAFAYAEMASAWLLDCRKLETRFALVEIWLASTFTSEDCDGIVESIISDMNEMVLEKCTEYEDLG
jgi:hypothetical protein